MEWQTNTTRGSSVSPAARRRSRHRVSSRSTKAFSAWAECRLDSRQS
ncbi:hypothetical protein SGRIM128S_07763 [Streptomyces griseomycini]